MIADYYRYISYLDSQIGRVLDALAASPHAKNTLVVFAADSGVARGGHGLIGKQNLYELDAVRVPLILAGPGIAANQRTEAMCYLFDVLPTLGKLCGVPAPAESAGIDFMATLRDAATPGRVQLLFAYKNVQRAIAQGNWKLIRYPYANQTQLFDLQLDPFEENNLADQPEHAARVAELTALLQQEMERCGDRAPLQISPTEPAVRTRADKALPGRKAKPPPTPKP
jgi:arylsulfatase A-like enzyme